MASTDRTRRPRGIPPAPPPQPQSAALRVGSDALGVVLWTSVRSVTLWAGVPDGERGDLFRRLAPDVLRGYEAARGEAPAIARALDAFLALQRRPAMARPDRVARACDAVREWAERAGHVEAALLFAEAAAYAEPEFPRWPVLAGFLARTLGGEQMLGRAHAWYARAFVLAVRERDRRHSILALTGRAAILKEEGRFEEARAVYGHAVRRAVRFGRKRQAAQVEHYLFALCGATGELDRAIPHAEAALDLYPRHDERIPYLAHDLGYLLLHLGHYRQAWRLLDAASVAIDRPHELALVFSAVARAAAGCGRTDRYRSAERAALDLVRTQGTLAANALINLAEASRLARDWEAADRYVREAERLTQGRSDPEVERLAREIRAAVERRESTSVVFLPSDSPAARLARRLAARLRGWKRRGRGIRTRQVQGSVSGHEMGPV